MRRLGLAPIALVIVPILLAGLRALGQDQSASPASNTPPVTSSPLTDFKPDASGKLSQEQMQQLFRIVADKDIENDKQLRDYT
jgi:hypothetical protein